jgi:hypothetical protein
VFRLQLTVILPSSNHLLSRLLHVTPDAAVHLQRVDMVPGPWHIARTQEGEGHVYFPESGLLGLFGSGTPLSTGMALLGCKACWWSGGMNPMQMQVLQAGHAQRILWSVLQAQPQRFAPWLLQIAAASQQLVQHMAQMVFCKQNHSPLQRLASGLLMVLNQKPTGDGPMSVAELSHWLAYPQSEVQALAQALQAQDALLLAGDAGVGTQLKSLKPQVLTQLACSCHMQSVQGLGRGGLASA